MEAARARLEQGWRPTREGVYGLPFVAATREKLLDAMAQTAFTSLGVYGNCCRSTAWAVLLHLRRESASILRASSVMAGGICGTGETCGAVLGGLQAIGEMLASDDFRDVETYAAANAAAKRFVEGVHGAFGSTRCFSIQKAVMGWCCDDPGRAEEWQAADGPTACAGVCASLARLAGGIVLDATSEGPQ